MTINTKKHESILDYLWEYRYSEKPQLFFYKNLELIESWNYSQIWSSAQRVAQYLEKWPAKTPVFISLPNGPEFVSSLFACQMQGLWPAPIVSPDIWNRQDYLDYIGQISKRTGIKDIICHAMAAADLKSIGLNAILFSDVWAATEPVKELKRFPRMSTGGDLALLQFSSGSTSDSKGVMLSQERICINLRQIVKAAGLLEGDRICTWLPMYHDMGIIGGLFTPLMRTMEVHLSSPIDFVAYPSKWLKHAGEKKATIMVGPDFMYKLLARKGKETKFEGDLSSLRVCMTGAEPVIASTCADFRETYRVNGFDQNAIMPVYGMAEAVLGVAFFKPTTNLRSTRLPENETDWVSCGRPLEGIEIEIRDLDGHILDQGQSGEIYLRSPAQTIGFYQRPDLDNELLANGWLKTGDVGFLSEGEIFITGRTKDIIIINGRKIHSIDIENKVQSRWKDDFSRVAAITASESATNKTLILALEIRNRKSLKIKKEDIKRFLATGSQDIDFRIFYVPKKSLPRTSSGKLKRFKIREMYSSGELEKLTNPSFIEEIRKRANEAKFIFSVIKSKFQGSTVLDVANVDSLRSDIEKVFRQATDVKGEVDFTKSFDEWKLAPNQMSLMIKKFETEFGQTEIGNFGRFKNLQEIYNFIKMNQTSKKSA